MIRLLVIGAVLAAVLAGRAAAAPITLLPGVAYDRQVEFTPHGPVVLNILTAPRPGGLYALRPVLAKETVPGTETVSSIERRISVTATAAGVNGDLFVPADGRPIGVVMRAGVLDHAPLGTRSSLGIDSSGTLHVDRVRLLGTWQGAEQRRGLSAVNEPPGANGVSLFTPAWGSSTPVVPGSLQVVLNSFPPAAPQVELAGPVGQVLTNGPAAIPAGGAVLVATGNAATYLSSQAPPGQTVKIRLVVQPSWGDIVDAIGGGPLLVRNGVPVFRSGEDFANAQLLPRGPRTAVGQRADGTVVLVTVDGRQPGYSIGLTTFELAQVLGRLGVVTGMALDSGDSTAMAFDGQLLSSPAVATGERPVSNALLVLYAGVYAPPPSTPVLSPNGDGVAEREALSYRLVRPSTVTVRLVGPDGVARIDETAAKEPGTYSLDWPGTTAAGAPEAEGTWHWTIGATDDRGQASSIDRTFSLNDTLGFLKAVVAFAVPSATPQQVATYTLAHPAIVAATIETDGGTVVLPLPSNGLAAGRQTVVWDGLDLNDAPVAAGAYQVRVTATNGFGTVELTAPLIVQRSAPAHKAKRA